MSAVNELDGRLALVTGAGGTVGAAIAAALAAAGADLAIVGRNPDRLVPVGNAAEAAGRAVLRGTCDVTDPAEVRALVDRVTHRFGRGVDILVNAAGGNGGESRPLWEIPPATFDRIVAVNLKGAFVMMAAVLPGMIARRAGRIVNISGTFGLRGRAGRAAYSAAKWGLRGLTKSAALEAGPFNVTVNCVCPGLVEGPELDAANARLAEQSGISADEAAAQIGATYALGRASTAEDVAQAVLFLAGERARQMTGQDVVVDGGWAM